MTRKSMDTSPKQQPEQSVIGDGLKRCIDRAEKLAAANLPMLVIGETGTGKELVCQAYRAKWLEAHGKAPAMSPRPFNCTGFTDELLRSELFGHKKGAFTGAIEETKGIFGDHPDGLVCLDELGDARGLIQAQLLRLIENHEYLRVGEPKATEWYGQVIAATNNEAGIRGDLAFRFHRLYVPPLRDRLTDIVAIAEAKGIRAYVRRFLYWAIEYGWPGNIRELLRLVFERRIEGYILDLPYRDPLEPIGSKLAPSYSRFPRWDGASGNMLTSPSGPLGTCNTEQATRFFQFFDEMPLRAKEMLGLGDRVEDKTNTSPEAAAEGPHAESERDLWIRKLLEAGSAVELALREGKPTTTLRDELKEHKIKVKDVLPHSRRRPRPSKPR